MIKQWYFLLMGFVLFALLFVSLSISVQQSSPLKQFNVTPDSIYLNWTNNYASNITIIINASFENINVTILNGTSDVSSNYSQANTASTQCQASYYHLFVKNGTGNYVSVTQMLNGTNSTDMTIQDTNITYDHTQCSPGRYWINKLTLTNTTQTNETANITVIIDIPISSSNSANILSTGIGTFGSDGVNLPINATNYHSYYFNTSLVPNATGIMINLTGWAASQDVDLFLFDNSTIPVLKAKSINKTHTVESLLYNYLPSTEKIWEIRVYGNNSTSAISYNGRVIFTTLNVTNSSNLQVSSINFGVMNASELKQIEITLRNEGNLTLSNVAESKELYRLHKFGDSGNKNFTFFVLDSSIATKVKVSLNWTGSSNYSFNLYNSTGSVVASSMNKYVYANVTGAIQEEYNETSGIFNAGIWKVEVKNNSASTDPYNVSVYVYVLPTNWISTNYSTMTFNRTGNANYTYPVKINFTAQNNTMDGLYEGYIQYLDVNGAGIKIPMTVNITTPMIVINNTLNSTTITVDEDYGSNLTRTFSVYVNNTGFYGLNVILTNSSNGTMSCISGTGCSSGYYANFSYNSITSIDSYSSQTLNVSITFNSSMPTGVYEGWILFNATNSSVNLTSHPYGTFNLTLRLNLTNLLDVRVQEVKSTDGDTWTLNSSVENATAKFKIYYVNGTGIESQNSLNISNFTVWLTHVNVTSYRIPTSGSLNLYNGTNPIYIDPFYTINFTIPANSPGGQYSVHVMANYTRNPTYGGEGVNQTLVINNTGLKLTALTTTSFSFYEGGSASYLNISVVNYGPINPGGSITMDDWANATITAISVNESCSGTPSGRSFPFTASTSGDTVDANGTEACVFSWKIQPASSVSSDTEVSNLKILATDANFSGIENIYILVQNNVTTTTTTTPSSSGQGTSGGTSGNASKVSGTTNYLDITDYTSSISIEQGGSKKVGVTVKNTNNTLTQNMLVSVNEINPSWYSVNPSTAVKLKRGESYDFEVTFNIPTNATIGSYPGKFNATSVYINPVRPTVSFIYDIVLKDFTLKVIPGEALKSEIKSKLSGYTNDMNILEQQINQSKSQNFNTSLAEVLFNQLKAKVDQANSYVNSEDYTSANNLLNDISTLINQTKTAMTSLSKITGQAGGVGMGDWWSWGKWVVAVVVAVVVGVLAYMLWPTKLEGKEKAAPGLTVPTPEGKDKIKDTFAKLRERWKKAKEGAKT